MDGFLVGFWPRWKIYCGTTQFNKAYGMRRVVVAWKWRYARFSFNWRILNFEYISILAVCGRVQKLLWWGKGWLLLSWRIRYTLNKDSLPVCSMYVGRYVAVARNKSIQFHSDWTIIQKTLSLTSLQLAPCPALPFHPSCQASSWRIGIHCKFYWELRTQA